MFSIISLLLVISFSILLTRIATVALTLTGLSREAARFQARSALSGTGFTTAEAEKVVAHPVRRKIILLLMLLGNAGIITAVSTLILGFVGQDGGAPLWIKVALLIAGLSALWSLAQSRWVDQRLSRFIERGLKKYQGLDVRDYSTLMHLGGDYQIAEIQIADGDWLADKTLEESNLRAEGAVVLGIESPDGSYQGAPHPGQRIKPGDVLLVYGRAATLAELDQRKQGRQGAREHRKANAEEQSEE